MSLEKYESSASDQLFEREFPFGPRYLQQAKALAKGLRERGVVSSDEAAVELLKKEPPILRMPVRQELLEA